MSTETAAVKFAKGIEQMLSADPDLTMLEAIAVLHFMAHRLTTHLHAYIAEPVDS